MTPRKRILVVDDEPGIRTLVSRVLGGDFEILTAGNGPDALKIAGEAGADLVILDIAMPGMDGYAVAEVLRNDYRTRSVPILMLTALSGPADFAEAFASGANLYMTKPFDPVELCAHARRLLSPAHSN